MGLGHRGGNQCGLGPHLQSAEKAQRRRFHRQHPRQPVSVLLDNAVKYADSGGSIRLCLENGKKGIVLSTSNPCAGLDTAELDKLFDRFIDRTAPVPSRREGLALACPWPRASWPSPGGVPGRGYDSLYFSSLRREPSGADCGGKQKNSHHRSVFAARRKLRSDGNY